MKRLVISIGIVVGLCAATGQAIAQDHAAATTLKECGACHMAFPPQLLPARSWKKIMSGLSDHFGENADLAEPTRAEITAYLVAHAADAPGTANGYLFLRGVDAGAVPLRITQLPFWKAVHSEIPAREFKSAQVKSAANCLACHRSGGRGESGESE
jgi:cytochrome c551/c552